MSRILFRRRAIGKTESEARFWGRFTTRDGCWVWGGPPNNGGYGTASVNGKNGMAHRHAYELTIGPIPLGKTLDHLCRNRMCINPDHLEPVDLRTNILRGTGFSAQKAAQTNCIRGHPLSGDNLYTKPNGSRNCRACRREALRQLYARRRAACS